MNKSADRQRNNNSLFLTKKPTHVVCFTYILAILLAIIGCNSLSVAKLGPNDLQTVQSATQQFVSPTSPAISFSIETLVRELSTPTGTPTSESIGTVMNTPSVTLLTVPAPISTRAYPAPLTPTLSPTPNTILANGLILLLPNLSHHVIIKNGQDVRLSYEDALLLGTNAPLLGMAVGPNGQLFSLSVSFVDGQRPVIAAQQGGGGKETFFDDDRYEATRIYGVVGEWLIVSVVPKEPPPGQAMGDLAALSLDGSQIEFIGRDTVFTPIVAPDQSFVIFHEGGETKRWRPQSPIEKLSLPEYWFGQFSPDGRYLALVEQNNTLTVYDFHNATLVATDQVGGYLDPFSASSLIWNRTSHVLAYVSFREEVDAWILRTVAVDGEIKDYENFFNPAFSADGLQMAVRLGGEEPKNLIFNLQTGEATPIQVHPGQFSAADPVFWLDFDSGE
jgi:hypothetical protein